MTRVALAELFLAAAAAAAGPEFPIRGLHVAAPRPDEVPMAVRFISEALPKEGVNVLVLEIGYGYRFTRRLEVADPGGLTREHLAQLVGACRRAGIRLVPEINCLGHQSWGKGIYALLRAHPEFDETPGRYPENEGIYCRSYCPLHPRVHEVVFDLIDEIADACDSSAFHAGMDEVFLIGEDDCPRCRGKNKGELFAGEVRALRDHLAKSGRTLWIWGDRLLDGETTGAGRWEASMNGTHAAVRMVPKDVVICDWHYERAMPTSAWFATEGFTVLSSPWRKPEVALGQLELIRHVRANAPEAVASRMAGVLATTWCGMGPFTRGYYGEAGVEPRVMEVVRTFRALFEAMRADTATR